MEKNLDLGKVSKTTNLFAMKEFFFSLKSYNGVSRESKECFNEVSRMFHATFMDWKFQGCLRKFQGRLRGVSMEF